MPMNVDFSESLTVKACVCTRLSRVHSFSFARSRERSMVAPAFCKQAFYKSASAVGGLVVKVYAASGAARAAAVAAIVGAAPGAGGWLGAGLALVMLAIAVIDARHFIIPDPLNAAGLALGFVHAAAQGEGDVASALAAAALRGTVLALMFLALRVLYVRMRGRQGIGLGDFKLAAVGGAWLGWIAMPIAIEIAALSALAVFATRHFVFRRPVRATTRLPFGLFFAPAIWIGWLLQATVLQPY
jgi:leader peptidase (prepilin peptidase)/N-methyltransferase